MKWAKSIIKTRKKIFFYLFIALTTVGLALPSIARANYTDGELFSLKLETIPEAVSAGTGYLNSNSTGFRVYAQPVSGLSFEKIAIFVDGETTPLDERIFDASASDYYLSSNTSSLSQIQLLLPEGLHKIHFNYIPSGQSDYINYYSFDIISDFTPVHGLLSYQTTEGRSTLAIGDQVDLIFRPNLALDDVAIVQFDFNGQKYNGLKLQDGSYRYDVNVSRGDIYDGSGLIGVTVIDFAGNSFYDSVSADFVIDGVPPVVSILSPTDGGRYGSRNISITYAVSGSYVQEQTTILLDGQLITNPNLVALGEGLHFVDISVFDLAGNFSTARANFQIDVSPPAYISGSIGGTVSLVLGSQLLVDGQTDPDTSITLETCPGEIMARGVSDASGYFNLNLLTNDLSLGTYELYATLCDDLANCIKIKVSTITIVAEQTEQASSSPTKLAQADLGAVSGDAAPRMVYRPNIVPIEQTTKQNDEEVVAKAGQISSASDTKVVGSRYTIYLLIISLIVIALTIFSAGYYGYGLFIDASGTRLVRRKTSEGIKYNKDEALYSGATNDLANNSKDSTPEDEKQVRW